MTAVILAAGVASRLRPLTDNTPKCLLQLGKQTILGRSFDYLLVNGMEQFIIVTGYLGSQIVDFIGNTYTDIRVKFVHNAEYATTNNIYSLWLALQNMEDEAMLLLDSDILFDPRIIGLLLDSSFENCLALKSTHRLGEEEIKVRINGQGYITDISKEVDPNLAIGESIGIEKFSSSGLRALRTELDRMIVDQKQVNVWYESAFQNCINDGLQLWPVDVGRLVCMELDTPEDLHQAEMEVIPQLDR